jgi:TMEM175 potassium channel family protein
VAEPGPGETRERERDLERVLTFLDAIVAIAITLLVLPLAEAAGDVSDQVSVADLLDEHRPEIWAFLLSFAVIARLWYSQHQAVRHLVRMDGPVFVIVMAWAATIVFLPFPTSLVAEAPNDSLTKVFYMGTMALNMLMLAILDVWVIRHQSLGDGLGRPNLRAALINAGLLVVALVISVAVPATSYLPLLLLALDGPIDRALPGGRR